MKKILALTLSLASICIMSVGCGTTDDDSDMGTGNTTDLTSNVVDMTTTDRNEAAEDISEAIEDGREDISVVVDELT